MLLIITKLFFYHLDNSQWQQDFFQILVLVYTYHFLSSIIQHLQVIEISIKREVTKCKGRQVEIDDWYQDVQTSVPSALSANTPKVQYWGLLWSIPGMSQVERGSPSEPAEERCSPSGKQQSMAFHQVNRNIFVTNSK